MKDLFGNPIMPERVRRVKEGLVLKFLATDESLPLTWSYGGGTQSIALVLLVKEGKLPKPEIIVMADTAYEKSRTWEYHEQHVQPILDELGIPFVVAPHSLATVDLWGGKDGQTLLIPAFTTLDQRPGEWGKLPTFCSGEWKEAVFFRQLKALGYGPGTEQPRVQVWMGMSRDEIHRLKYSRRKWAEYKYPLVADIPLHRAQCKELLRRHGLPQTISSECWMCPNQQKIEWQVMQEESPKDYEKAGKLERRIRMRDPHVWFSEYGAMKRLCLDEIVWAEVSDEGLMFKAEGCVSGMCNI